MSNFSSTISRMSRGNGASSLRSKVPLTTEQMMAVAPSIFASSPHQSLSAKYTQIPTSLVVEGLRSEGFLPFAIGQSGSRDETKRGHTRHIIRLRRENMGVVGDSHPEIALINSHDGTSRYHMLFGWFRLVCANGMVVANGPETEVKIRHSGNAQQVLEDVIGGAHQLVASVDQQAEQLEMFRTTRLQPAEAELLANAAIDVRFDERPAGLTAAHVLEARRQADQGNDLWTTVNRIQENLVRGGIRFRNPVAHKRQRTRAVRIPSRDDLIAALQAERYQMSPLTSVQFWLCVDETRCELVKQPANPFGIFKRGRIDCYFSNKQIEQLADDLLEGLVDSDARIKEK